MLNSELVVSHYNEDLSWLDSISSRFDKITIYHKGTDQSFDNVLPNIGRESHTYLWHIVNANEYAANTVFTQGNPSDHISDVNLLCKFTESPFEWRTMVFTHESPVCRSCIIGRYSTPKLVVILSIC